MKRTWIGAGLLALLLTAGVLVGAAMEARVTPGAEKLRGAAEAALAGDWERAEGLTRTVREDWERVAGLAEILATHEDLEQIGITFSQLPSYAGVDGPAYSALCTALARQLEALGKTHGCSWRNLL